MTVTIYILLLANSKYYIGKTTKTISERFIEHLTKSEVSCAWTTLYKPELIINSYESSNPFEEDNQTKKYMFEYGIENVRGGSYTKIILDIPPLDDFTNTFVGLLGT